MENKNSKLIILVLVLILIIGAVAVIINARLTKQLGQTLKQSAELPQQTAQPTSEVLIGPTPPGYKVSVKLTSEGFEPKTVTVPKNERIYLTIENSSSDWYNLVWDKEIPNESPAAGIIGENQTITYIFQAPKEGTYKFYSARPEHSEIKEKLTLEVVVK